MDELPLYPKQICMHRARRVHAALHPTPYTLHPTPYTLHPTPYTLHPTPCTLHPTPYTSHPTPYTYSTLSEELHGRGRVLLHLGLEVPVLPSGVWGLGFGIWGLGFGV